MPSPKSGTPCTLVPPVSPSTAQEADNADPGEMSQVKADQAQKQSGKYGSVPVKPFRPADTTDANQPPHWIEIQLVGEDGKPIAGEPYQITLPDASVASGTTDGKGLARVDGIPDAGSCQITFPNRDQEAWTPA